MCRFVFGGTAHLLVKTRCVATSAEADEGHEVRSLEKNSSLILVEVDVFPSKWQHSKKIGERWSQLCPLIVIQNGGTVFAIRNKLSVGLPRTGDVLSVNATLSGMIMVVSSSTPSKNSRLRRGPSGTPKISP